MNKLCIKCGKSKDLINGLCRECFKSENPLLKGFKEFKITMCSECKNYMYKNLWKKSSLNEIEDVLNEIAGKIFKDRLIFGEGAKLEDVEFYVNLPDNFKITEGKEAEVELEVVVNGKLNGIELSEEYIAPFKINFSRCNNCKKEKGNYFEATLQIRPKNEEVLNFVKEHCKDKGNLFISRVEEEKFGYDVYLSEQKEARNLGVHLKKRFGGELIESKKIFGKKDGRDVYRATILFRLKE